MKFPRNSVNHYFSFVNQNKHFLSTNTFFFFYYLGFRKTKVLLLSSSFVLFLVFFSNMYICYIYSNLFIFYYTISKERKKSRYTFCNSETQSYNYTWIERDQRVLLFFASYCFTCLELINYCATNHHNLSNVIIPIEITLTKQHILSSLERGIQSITCSLASILAYPIFCSITRGSSLISYTMVQV